MNRLGVYHCIHGKLYFDSLDGSRLQILSLCLDREAQPAVLQLVMVAIV